ncbi:HTH-type transcriptional regulator TauR [Ensifer sp. M14]|jgi:DNA-binding transcriptional MocR family regulator|uniref:aminotransferase-like domain-containing protein n=1 Tax=Ensifer sp. M14 TaxID=2203782 RepID=UPI000E1C95EB|nr:PLP-dependent aminotransferase family protein [Ensifer sp. M14]RDL46651.1 HTH-type transcriptional regulator TauR [Ensifer sp. M14]
MTLDASETTWLPAIRKANGPLYIAIADAIAVDIAEGRLSEGARLPPQRALAGALGIDFTTVSRAYNEARHRGLVEGRVGQGTYVKARRMKGLQPAADGLVDMSMNLPPLFDDPVLTMRLWSDIASLQSEHGLDLLMRYQAAGGAQHNRTVGATWLRPRLGDIPAERVLICAGAQSALLAVVSSLAGAGEAIAAEAIAYPGLRALAAHLSIELVGIPIDENGMIPEQLEAICKTRRLRALYCNPTLHNPTTSTLPLERRKAIVAIARTHGLAIIEDDAYGAIPAAAPSPLASLAPDLAYHIAGLAKCLSPALRIAYLVVPDRQSSVRMEGAIRATSGMAPPFNAAVATRWIEDGTASEVLRAIRREVTIRQAMVSRLLPKDIVQTDQEGFHLWLHLPPPWTRGDFSGRLRASGISVVASDAFALGPAPEAVRLGLGAARTHEELQRSLMTIADLLQQTPTASSLVV